MRTAARKNTAEDNRAYSMLSDRAAGIKDRALVPLAPRGKALAAPRN